MNIGVHADIRRKKHDEANGSKKQAKGDAVELVSIEIYNAIMLTMKKFKSMEILHNIMVQILSTEN